MGTKPPALSLILVAVLFALSVFAFTLFVWRSFGGPIPFEAKGYRFDVVFGPEATQMSANAQVRISGVPVGKVVAVDPGRAGIRATLQLESAYAPMSRDVRAIVRSKTLLGETYIELTPGSPDGPKLEEGDVIPRSQVERPQGVDEVLGSFDRPTRNALKRFLQDVSKALDDRGPDLNAALGHLGPAAEDLDALVTLLDDQRPAVQGLIRDTGEALRAIGERGADVRELIRAGDAVLSETAARDSQVTGVVRELPGFLRELRATLGELEGTAIDAAPTLRTLRPVARHLRPGLQHGSALALELERLFKGLGPVITASRTGLPALSHILKGARPLVQVLYPAGRELVPVVELLEAYRRDGVADIAHLGAALQATTTRADGSKLHYLRTLIPVNNEMIFGQSNRLASNRHNAYLAPGALDNFGRFEASDCRNTSNAQTIPVLGEGAPPCLEARPWTFRGASRVWPHAEQDGP